MVARASFLYSHTPITSHLVALIGLFTAAFAATIAVAQNDIKKVYAYSTISQLGYMFLGLGVGAYSTGIFHIMTHAFFKALLFLGAGSVIHSLSGEQDLRHMGGLRKAMPITFITLLAASLAISGIPPFAGYFSKDAILLAAYQYSPWMYWVGVATAGLTAFYIFRAFFLAFVGEYRGHHRPHESPAVMTLPLIVLGLLSTGGGFIDVTKWLAPMYPHAEGENLTLMMFSVLAGVIGIAIAALLYWIRPAIAQAITESALYRLVYNKFYVDEIYAALITKPVELVSRFILWKGVDDVLIDGAVDGGGRRIRGVGAIFRRMQSGEIRNYATWVMMGSIIVLAILGLAGGGR